MNKQKLKNGDAPLEVFKYTDSGWQILIALGLIAFVVIGFSATLQEARLDSDPPFHWAILLLGLVFAYPLLKIFQQFSTQVEIYEHGIAVRSGSSLIYSTWENTSHIEYRVRGRSKTIGIVTFKEVEHQITGTWFERVLTHKPDERFIELGAIKIPTQSVGMMSPPIVDTYALTHTEFGYYLDEYAPHLLGKERKS